MIQNLTYVSQVSAFHQSNFKKRQNHVCVHELIPKITNASSFGAPIPSILPI
jgi:hypothetical protein